MLLLRVVDSRGSITQHLVKSFPYSIGRGSDADLRLEAPGVWESHASISLREDGKFVVQAQGGALLLVHNQSVSERELSIGDEFFVGSSRILVNLAPVPQKALLTSELGAWCLLLTVVVIEAVFIWLVS